MLRILVPSSLAVWIARAVHGNDPNWGRVLSALGTTDITFEPDRVDVAINGSFWVGAAMGLRERFSGFPVSIDMVSRFRSKAEQKVTLENLAAAIALVLSSPRAEGETFLVADSEPISVAELVSAMREGLGRAPHLVRVPAGAVKRLMATFGREAEWERLSGSFVIDAANAVVNSINDVVDALAPPNSASRAGLDRKSVV